MPQPESLLLLRHAKSSWADSSLNDQDRPLNSRGRRAATDVGRWLAAHGPMPDHVLVSDSCRTRQTWDGVAAELPDAPEAEFLASLYHGSPGDMLEVIHSAPADCQRLMLIGHNPGMAHFARWLAVPPTKPTPRLLQYPTAALSVFSVSAGSWADFEPDHCELVQFVDPRELE